MDVKEKLILICIIAAIVALFGWSIYMKKYWDTNNILHEIARSAEKEDRETGRSGEEDAWYNPIHLIRFNDEENNRIVYTAISAGRDEIMDTEDDQTAVRIDVNWSKRAGKASMDVGKEFFKGPKENFGKESKFEKE